jgi:hypothetical protein
MRLAPLTSVADDSRTMLNSGLSAAGTIAGFGHFGAAVPLYTPHSLQSRFSANADPRAGLNC